MTARDRFVAAALLVVATGILAWHTVEAGFAGALDNWAYPLGTLTLAVTAVWALARRAGNDNVLMHVLLATAVCGTIVIVAATVVQLLVEAPPGRNFQAVPPADMPQAAALVAAFGGSFWVPTVGLLGTFGLALFPDGRLPSRRWRWLVPLAVLATLAVMAEEIVVSWPTSTTAYAEAEGTILGALGWPLLLAAMVASIASLVVRYRRAGGMQRHQLRWLLLGATVLVGSLVVPVGGEGQVPAMIGITVFFAAYGVAVLRYRLYDIDIVISRSVTFAGLGLFITGIYVAVVVGIGSLIGRGDEPNLLLSILATALVAVAFQPARARLRRWANRLVYGERATPYEVITGLARSTTDQPSADVLPRVAELLVAGTGADAASVWVRVEDSLRRAASHPPAGPVEPLTLRDVTDGTGGGEPGELRQVVRHEGEVLGMVSVRPGRGKALTTADRDLVTDVTDALGLLLRNVRLTAELRDRIDELERSRQRILAAQDEARRKIEREIHTGPEQGLSALRSRLTVAEEDARIADAGQLATLMGELERDTSRAITTLRELAGGVYPPRLQADGLAAALAAHAGMLPLPVTVHAPGVGRFSPEVEAAVYFTVLEALSNAIKYAHGTSARVALHTHDGELHFAVSDDGAGFDPQAAGLGTGLHNMHDRVGSVHGALHIESAPGAGTTVRGRVPVVTADRDEDRDRAPV